MTKEELLQNIPSTDCIKLNEIQECVSQHMNDFDDFFERWFRFLGKEIPKSPRSFKNFLRIVYEGGTQWYTKHPAWIKNLEAAQLSQGNLIINGKHYCFIKITKHKYEKIKKRDDVYVKDNLVFSKEDNMLVEFDFVKSGVTEYYVIQEKNSNKYVEGIACSG